MKKSAAGKGLALLAEHGEKFALGLVVVASAVGFVVVVAGSVNSADLIGPRRASAGAGAGSVETTDVLALLAPKPLTHFAALYERDPFSVPELKAPVVPSGGGEPVVAPPTQRDSQLRISGISIGTEPIATIIGTTKEVEVIKVGDTFQVNVAGTAKTYEVTAIDATGVEIEDLDTGAKKKLLLSRQEVNPEKILETTSSAGPGGVAAKPAGE